MQLQEGEILEGKVTGVKNFGAFVLLPDGTTGMVHISEVSNDYIQELSGVLTEGQMVKVKVVGVSADGKVSLSIKRAQEQPAGAPRQPRQPKPPRTGQADSGYVWQPKAAAPAAASFEDMMSRYKSQSEEKISDLKRVTEARRGGYSRRR